MSQDEIALSAQYLCDHKWVYIEGKRRTEYGSYQTRWILTERFYCENCLKHDQTVQDEWSRDAPAWW